jgi:hypothetical protein
MNTNEIISLLTPVIAPIITGVVRKVFDKIPKWTLPIICGLLGGVIQVIDNALGGQIAWWQGILLGLAGVGVREVFDQLNKLREDVKTN